MFKKGKSGNPNGRPAGRPNKTTQEIRDAYQAFVEDQVPEFQKWLSEIEDPHKRFDVVLKLSQYFVPKLNTTEITGKDGADLFKDLKVSFNTAPKKDEEDKDK